MDYKCDLCNQKESIVGNLITGIEYGVDWQICKECLKKYGFVNPYQIVIKIQQEQLQQYKQQIDELIKKYKNIINDRTNILLETDNNIELIASRQVILGYLEKFIDDLSKLKERDEK